MVLKHVIALAALLGAGPALAQQVGQDDPAVHPRASVMPFDLARSTQTISVVGNGSVQDVISDDGDARQAALIRSYLRREAQAVARGGITVPEAVSRQDVPGLAELQAGTTRVLVEFDELPEGGRLIYTAEDPLLVQALWLWVGAPLREKGIGTRLRIGVPRALLLKESGR